MNYAPGCRIALTGFLILLSLHSIQVHSQAKDSGAARKILANAVQVIRTDTSEALLLFDQAKTTALRDGDKRTAAEIYLRIAEISKTQDSTTKAIRSYKESARLYNEAGMDEMASRVYCDLGKYESDFSRFEDAMSSFRKSDEIAAEKHFEVIHGNNLVGMGMVFAKQGELVQAQQNFVVALELFELLNDSLGIGDAWNGIGVIHWKEGKNDEAMEAYQKSLVIRQSIRDSMGIAATYSNMGVICRIQKKLEEGLTYYMLALGIRERNHDNRGVSQVLFNIGSLYTDMGRSDDGLEYYARSYAIKQRLGDHYGRLPYFLNTGELYGSMGKSPQQEAAYLTGLALADSLKAADYIKSFTLALSEYYSAHNDFSKAYYFSKRYSDIKDTLLSREKNAELSRLQTSYDLSEKQRSIEALTRDREKLIEKEERDKLLRYALIVIIVIVFGFSIFIINRTLVLRRTNTELVASKKLVEMRGLEKEVLLREVHHRVKNNLQLTSSMLNLQAREITDVHAVQALKDARDRIKAISIVHQELFANDAVSALKPMDYIPSLCRSIESSHASSQNISINFDIDPVEISLDIAVPLGLFINEAVTNSIKHAFGNESGCVISIICKASPHGLLIAVKDNGKGVSSKIITGEGSGFGMKLLISLGTRLGSKTEFTHVNGTTVSVLIPGK